MRLIRSSCLFPVALFALRCGLPYRSMAVPPLRGASARSAGESQRVAIMCSALATLTGRKLLREVVAIDMRPSPEGGFMVRAGDPPAAWTLMGDRSAHLGQILMQIHWYGGISFDTHGKMISVSMPRAAAGSMPADLQQAVLTACKHWFSTHPPTTLYEIRTARGGPRGLKGAAYTVTIASPDPTEPQRVWLYLSKNRKVLRYRIAPSGESPAARTSNIRWAQILGGFRR